MFKQGLIAKFLTISPVLKWIKVYLALLACSFPIFIHANLVKEKIFYTDEDNTFEYNV